MTLLNPQDFHLEWDKLKTFYYIAKLGNITKAAEFLRLSQSALSKSLKILEDCFTEKQVVFA